jgi:hypothetical protein
MGMLLECGTHVDRVSIVFLQLSESERLAREHKARQQRKLLLFSSNFGQHTRIILNSIMRLRRPAASDHALIFALLLSLLTSLCRQSMPCVICRLVNSARW